MTKECDCQMFVGGSGKLCPNCEGRAEMKKEILELLRQIKDKEDANNLYYAIKVLNKFERAIKEK